MNDARFEQPPTTATTARPSTLYQIRFVFIQMFEQRTLRCVSHWFGFDDARRFTLPFLNEFLRLFVRSLKIGDAERFPAIRRHVANPIAQIIATRRLHVAIFTEPAFFNLVNHDYLHSSIFALGSAESELRREF